MIPLGLSPAEAASFHAGLVGSHSIRVRVAVLDLEHAELGSASDVLLSGQVDFHTREAVDRSCSLELLDPGNALGLDAGNPHVASNAGTRMVQVHYGVRSEKLPRWVDVPVFCGPITTTRRDEDRVQVTAHGKESLLLGACRFVHKWPKGTRTTDIIRGLLVLGGETRHEIPDLPHKSTVDTVIGPSDALWTRAQGHARALGWVLTYDGRGVAMLRRPSSGSQWTFRRGDGGSLLGRPVVSSDVSVVRNLVVVQGAEGVKAGVARAKASHPMSPENLGRNGRPRFLSEDITEQGISTQALAQSLADAKLAELLQAGMSVEFTALPIPDLEPRDRVTVVERDWTWANPVHDATLPLVADAPMTVGHHGVVRAIAGTGRHPLAHQPAASGKTTKPIAGLKKK